MTEFYEKPTCKEDNDEKINNSSNNNNEFICGVVEGFYGKPWTFDQRKDLFKRLKELKLNSFMYAPKDDTKHRAKWRQLYDASEASHLKAMIEEADANGIDFYYSLAPGLDIVYSSQSDADQLYQKFDQLKSLGCKSFAILFDDIEPNLTHEKDRVIFNNNYASAQVSVSNLIFEHLNKPKFLFCPTEYCESRAVPDVPNSLYLNTIGKGLHDGIDIMWSGTRVISRYITEESIKQLNSVIRRPVLIWENLHANDYDKRRVYLGPYSGRSTKIIPQLRGVLTNPNCEYEANYIAIHTLAQWKRCNKDSSPHNKCNQMSQPAYHNLHNSSNTPTKRFFLNQTKSKIFQDENGDTLYDPDRALVCALRDWLPQVLTAKSLPQGMDVNMSHKRNDDSASDQISKEEATLVDVPPPPPLTTNTTTTTISSKVHQDQHRVQTDSIIEEDMPEANRDKSPKADSTVSKSDMDTNSCNSCEMQDASEQLADEDPQFSIACFACSGSSLVQLNDCAPKVDLDSLELIVDFFYLPFEHGARGLAFLNDIKWLIDNNGILLHQKEEKSEDVDREGGELKKQVDIWLERAELLSNMCVCTNKIIDTLINDCPNKLIMQELGPYLFDLRSVIFMTIDYIKFLRFRKSNSERFYFCESLKQKDIVPCDEHEPWVHRGGLIGDIQRLISSS